MSSRNGFKAVAAITLVAAGAMLVVSPAVASSKNGKDDPDCQVRQPLRASRMLALEKLHDSMEMEVELEAAIEMRAHETRIGRADVAREWAFIRRASKLEAEKMRRTIELGRPNLDRWERSWRHADFASERPSHPVVSGVSKMAALAKLPGQGLMVAQKMFSTAAKLVPSLPRLIPR